MTKNNRKTKIDTYYWPCFEVFTIDYLISKLNDLKEEGYTIAENVYGINFTRTRLETEEEYNQRIKRKELEREGIRKQYEKLKKEFDP